MKFSHRLLASRDYGPRRLIDAIRVYVRGGTGGNGYPSLGGIGGNGGDVYVSGKEGVQMKALVGKNPSKRYVAGVGGGAQRHKLQGQKGEDLDIKVPVGVSVVKDDGNVIGEVNKHNDKVLVARGGRGACADNLFRPERGEALSVLLNLKLVADIGLVGFPNAGKSTLLHAISRAKPHVASYPFTTLHPRIATIDYSDHRQITIADLPGLIEGAHMNVGMGHHFLKHVERTKLLLYIVDIEGFILHPNSPKRDAIEMVLLLNKELELHKPELIWKPAVVLLNKIDRDVSGELVKTCREKLDRLSYDLHLYPSDIVPRTLQRFDDVLEVSTKYKINTDAMATRLRELMDIYADARTDFSNQLRKIYAARNRKGYRFDVG